MKLNMRMCWKCKEEKPLSEDFFYKDRIDVKGLQKACKVCQKSRNSLYAKSHADYFKKKGKEKYKKEDNPQRYQKYRQEYLERRDAESRSHRGRLYTLLDSARTRAKKKGEIFDLTLDWLLELHASQAGKCKLTKLPFTYDRNPNGERFYMPYSPSLDRIDSKKGYTKDNVRLVCVIVNLALNVFGEEHLSRMCHAYVASRQVSPPALPKDAVSCLDTEHVTTTSVSTLPA